MACSQQQVDVWEVKVQPNDIGNERVCELCQLLAGESAVCVLAWFHLLL